jgi:hypothetical protein
MTLAGTCRSELTASRVKTLKPRLEGARITGGYIAQADMTMLTKTPAAPS